MQVEIDTLRSRRDVLRAARQEDAERITESAQRYLAAEKRRLADHARQHKYEERMRTVGEKGQARLESQERAQNWLYGEK